VKIVYLYSDENCCVYVTTSDKETLTKIMISKVTLPLALNAKLFYQPFSEDFYVQYKKINQKSSQN